MNKRSIGFEIYVIDKQGSTHYYDGNDATNEQPTSSTDGKLTSTIPSDEELRIAFKSILAEIGSESVTCVKVRQVFEEVKVSHVETTLKQARLEADYLRIRGNLTDEEIKVLTEYHNNAKSDLSSQ
ncbi:TPA: hypothetical protein I7730_00175 [Vibrio vulnificus]|uniref:Uncharacterized protein n=1 Tax=Vibrio vulnificus TaxID=672 RepID=A0A8H9MYL2_VIBVL|nr:hypothetical protein [Vibrio vulnificus]